MPRHRFIPTVITVSLMIGICGYIAIPLTRMSRQWRGFVDRARRTVNPIQLQNWATNLLATQPDDYFDVRGTNVPAAVAALFPRRPLVTTIPEGKAVIVACGRGFPSIS